MEFWRSWDVNHVGGRVLDPEVVAELLTASKYFLTMRCTGPRSTGEAEKDPVAHVSGVSWT